jgi:uncharacterized coiled-coil protein SlyX
MKIPHSLSRSLLIAFALGSFALLPKARAVVTDPAGYFPGANTAEGQNALLSLTSGGFNTAVGWFSLKALTTGGFNTAVGAGALPVNTADRNTATGAGALFHNTDGTDNTATGAFALFNNIRLGDVVGHSNTATGVEALGSNLSGYENTATGVNALVGNTYGVRNTAAGVEALFSNVIGNFNTANGFQALHSNTSANYNTAIGGAALFNTTGGANIGVGFNAGINLTTGDLNIDIGNTGLAGESRTIRIGSPQIQTATYVAGIFGATVTDGAPVLVDINGHLGTAVSSARFKDGIKPMDKASEAILSLKPVTFRYKTDTKGTPQFGLIAEEVAKVNFDLVVRDEDGKPYTVRYDQVNAMLLNEFLKERCKVEAQQATIAELKSTVAQLQDRFGQQEAQIQALTSGLQKVSAQLEVRNHPPQTVAARKDR